MTPPDDRITALAKRIDPPAWVDPPMPVAEFPEDAARIVYRVPHYVGTIFAVADHEERQRILRRETARAIYFSRLIDWQNAYAEIRARREKAMDAARIAIALIEAQDMKQEGVDAHP